MLFWENIFTKVLLLYLSFRLYKLQLIEKIMTILLFYIPDVILFLLFLFKYMLRDDLRQITIGTLDVEILDVSFTSYINFLWRCKYSGINIHDIYSNYPKLGYIYIKYKNIPYILYLQNDFKGQFFNIKTQEFGMSGPLMFIEDLL